MTPEEQKFYAEKLEWMRTAVPSDGTLELSAGRKFDLFLARAQGKTQAATKYLVLVLPGGGYEFCSYREENIVGRFFARAGFDALVIDYPVRLYEEAVPGKGVGLEVMHVVGSVIKELRTRPELGFSEHKIVLCGFSAGGHLAATMATLYDSEELSDLGSGALLRPDGVILSYPVISADPKLAHAVTFGCFTGSADPQDWGRYSCERNVTADTPPMFIWHTATDEGVAVGNSLTMAQALWQHGCPCELHILARGPHGASLARAEVEPGFSVVDDYLAQWFDQAITFIRTFVR